MYAIVDIETTGGNANQGSITELAIFITDGKEILDSFETLVNPMRPIPIFIQKLTGITDQMVEDAPVFAEVAEKVFELLRDKVFVAHNVNFDYSFLAHQLNQQGYRLQLGKLCTVRLSRKLYEDLPSHSLGNLCRSLQIPISNRHRASGDAYATTLLFMKMLREDQHGHIDSMLKKGSRESYLPMHLNTADIENMPNTPGVYYFHDAKGKIIYVGKGKRLQKRVTSHFSNNSGSKKKQELMRMVMRISYRECGNETMASIYESIEIKRLWPAFNRSQKKFEPKFGICSFHDQRGILRLGIVKKKKNIQLHASYPMQVDGIRSLNRVAREHGLCPKMCFLQSEHVACVGVEESFCGGICEDQDSIKSYNKKVEQALKRLKVEQPTMAIFGTGRTAGELSCVLIDKGDYLATGFIGEKLQKTSWTRLKTLLEPGSMNEYIKTLVFQYAEENPEFARIGNK